MTPRDQNLITTLNLLSLLFRANKNSQPPLSEGQLHALTVKQDHLDQSHISLTVFLNSLKVLEGKGYLVSVGIFEKEYHQQIREATDEATFNKSLSLLSEQGINELTREQKLLIADHYRKILPPNFSFDIDSFLNDKVTIQELLESGKSAFQNHQDNEVAVVILMPFRDIDRLLDKMESGKSYEEIQDLSIWYDSQNYNFYIEGDVIPTNYQGKPNVEHYVLSRIPEFLNEGVIWFDEFEDSSNTSLKGSLTKFIAKNPKLKNIFTVHINRLEFDKEAFT